MMRTLDGFAVPVAVSGLENGSQNGTVVVLCAEQRPPAAYAALCARLHTASLRTVVIGTDSRLTPKSVVGILDALEIGWAVLVGDHAGAELAWVLAATRVGRFVGLVAIDRGHPRAADVADDVIGDEHCPPVEIGTTVLASSAAARAAARDSQRLVYADYRVVDLVDPRNAQESTAQLSTEIVLRASGW
ncbi:alpha/beta hydrolase [Mycobacterium decipiens]|uniref:Alpha/beta hydrolase n=1 Tax=Mycobacterium decipiens TaxID=1430326 RepID=A0A1X2LYT8_9MYCO|nr:alpha/beta hydrolase [Mycobacterium decipiens]OSC42402.1 alpha/beta hydrolase [Mycobacterium decipiens]